MEYIIIIILFFLLFCLFYGICNKLVERFSVGSQSDTCCSSIYVSKSTEIDNVFSVPPKTKNIAPI